jgi:hypothetical protein
LLLRIIFGPFTLFGVVAYHYGLRVTIVSLLVMLTFNRVITTLFIHDFQRMAAVAENTVMICMAVVTMICTVAHVIQEAVVRDSHGLDHFARVDIFYYLGQVVSNAISHF